MEHGQQDNIAFSTDSRTSKPRWVTPPSSRKPKRSYRLEFEFKALQRQRHVTTILNSGGFRDKLEGILQGQLSGRRQPNLPKITENPPQNVPPPPPLPLLGASVGGASGGKLVCPHSFVVPINDLRGVNAARYPPAERLLRCKLASLCRLAHMFEWGQLIYNYITARCSTKETHFLMNPHGLMLHEVTASSLVKLDLQGRVVDPGSTQLGVNTKWFGLHSAIYAARPEVRCVASLHTTAGAAVSAMSCGLLPISQEIARVGGVSYHHSGGDPWDMTERMKVAKALGPQNKVLLLRNYGVVAMGSSIEEAFYFAFHSLKACEIQVTSIPAGLSNLLHTSPETWGIDLNKVPDTLTASPGTFAAVGELEFEALMRMLDSMGYNTGYKYKGLGLLQPMAQSRKSNEEREKKLTALDEQARQSGEGLTSSSKCHSVKFTEPQGDLWTFLSQSQHKLPSTMGAPQASKVTASGSKKTTQEDMWGFLDSKQQEGKQKGQQQRQHKPPSREAGGDTSDEACDGETGTPHLRRRRARHTQRSSSSHSKSPIDAHPSPTRIDVDPSMGALEKAKYTAERVAHSTKEAVEKLAMQQYSPSGSTAIPSEHLEGKHFPQKSQRTLTTAATQWDDVTSLKQHSQTPEADSSVLAEQTDGHTSFREIGSTRGSSQTHSPLSDYLHRPADIDYPDGCSPGEMAAYAAEVVAGSTTTAVQKLSNSFTDKSSHSTSGFSGLVSPVS